jgi:hypothetical protein
VVSIVLFSVFSYFIYYWLQNLSKKWSEILIQQS